MFELMKQQEVHLKQQVRVMPNSRSVNKDRITNPVVKISVYVNIFCNNDLLASFSYHYTQKSLKSFRTRSPKATRCSRPSSKRWRRYLNRLPCRHVVLTSQHRGFLSMINVRCLSDDQED